MEVDITTIAAFIIGVLGTARLTRLIAEDDWPPMLWVREWYIVKLCKANSWSKLIECGFCVAPWVALPNLAVAWASGLAWYWWFPNLWLGGAYAASMTVARDIPVDN